MNPALDYPQIASRIFDQPLLIEQRKAQAILRVLSARMGLRAMEDEDGDSVPAPLPPAVHAAAMRGRRAERMPEGHYIAGAVGVIPVIGTLVQRGGYVGYSGLTAYDAIERMFDAAMNDAGVESILLEIDSPGGEVGGAFDLADRIFRARTKKPMTAVASEFAASAAYLIGSAANELVLPVSGLVGSIGVVTAHVDYSKHLEENGVAVTLIHAGEKKVDANPYQPLSDRARGELQADIDRLYGMFVDAVARHRGVDAKRIKATEAGMYMGALALDQRLADRIGTFGAEFSRALSTTRQGGRSRLNKHSPENTMSDEQQQEPANVALTAEQLDSERANAHAAGRKAERARIQTIVMHAEASGRKGLAQHIAFETDMAAEAATALLAKSPKAELAFAAGSLAGEMARAGTPGVTLGAPTDGDPPAEPTVSHTSIYARRNQAAKH